MKKVYQPQNIERSWYETWERNHYFSPDHRDNAYCIMIPPPNVTGSLHMGHAFQHSIMDTLVRYRRMQGRNSLWQVGTDHAGIATQMVVERKLLQEEGKTRHDLGREPFIEKIWDWRQYSGNTITEQMRRLGVSVDWETERFTMDEGFNKAVQEVFISLYEQDLIYRGKRLVNWDPKLHTAISDLEVESKEQSGKLWHFRYPLADGVSTVDGKDYLVIATTRPETLLGDSALAVNPKDERYQSLIGQYVLVPLVGRKIPIIADHYVDTEFGTGCVKITPAHDFNDYEMGKRHKLPLINVMDEEARILDKAQAFNWDGSFCESVCTKLPEDFAHLDRYKARAQLIKVMDEQGLLEGIENHTNKLPFGDRSGVVIEPLLTDQWFIKVAPLAGPAVDAVKNGDIQFVPKQYENMYFSWMKETQDWCISRQLWWGHRIPAFYDDNGKIYVADNEAEVRKKYQLDDSVNLRQDDDVLDTWFSSALWTFATLGWPEQTERLAKFHPTDVLVTGFDIIFFWVARMIMMTLHFVKDESGKPQVPFKTVYVTGLIRDEQGQKMSKSKGNVIDPLDMIDGIDLDKLLAKRTGTMMQPQQAEKIAKRTRDQFPEGIADYGTDALRFTLLSLASTGRDINWDMQRLKGYRNFCNKIWNAARYVLQTTENYQVESGAKVQLGLAEKWIKSRLQETIKSVTDALDSFRFDHAAQAVYEFIWNEYCDWYLELSKTTLWNPNATDEQKAGTYQTLLEVLEISLRLAHPFMPYLSEEIWQQIKTRAAVSGDSIMLAAFPVAKAKAEDEKALADMQWLKDTVVAIRNIRGQMNVSMGQKLPVLLAHTSETDELRLEKCQGFLQGLAKLASIGLLAEDQEAPESATGFVGKMQILIPMEGLIDPKAELVRLHKEQEKLNDLIGRLENKLGNAQFMQRAPAIVVEKEQGKLKEAKETLAAVNEKCAKLAQ